MKYDFDTMDDYNFEGKTVLLRVDVNSPVDPLSGELLDDTRMQLHSKTIAELSDKGAKVVILAHQSRPGKSDFTTLKPHALALSNILSKDVQYVDSIFSTEALNTIRNMVNGEIVLLENVRFFSSVACLNVFMQLFNNSIKSKFLDSIVIEFFSYFDIVTILLKTDSSSFVFL